MGGLYLYVVTKKFESSPNEQVLDPNDISLDGARGTYTYAEIAVQAQAHQLRCKLGGAQVAFRAGTKRTRPSVLAVNARGLPCWQ